MFFIANFLLYCASTGIFVVNFTGPLASLLSLLVSPCGNTIPGNNNSNNTAPYFFIRTPTLYKMPDVSCRRRGCASPPSGPPLLVMYIKQALLRSAVEDRGVFQSQMLIRQLSRHSSPGRALQKAYLDEERFVIILE